MSVERKGIIELPPKYYLDYFRYLIGFVQRLYGNLLKEKEWDFIKRFEQLSEDAQCLFVRFSNRRGLFFRANKLQYREIDELPAALGELLLNGFTERLHPYHKSIGEEALTIFTKLELVELLPLEPEELKLLTKEKKEKLIRYALHELDFEEIVASLTRHEMVVKVMFEGEVMLLKYLFFGNRSSDMTEFVIRDLGKTSFERYDEAKLTARFLNRKEVEDKLLISLTSEAFHDLKEGETPPEDIYNWFMNWNEARPELSEIAIPGYDRLVIRLGGYLERQRLSEQALQVYALTDKVPARERRVRLLYRSGEGDEALALCEEMAANPQNADERFFAIDFQEKIEGASVRKRIRKSTTRFLADAERVEIPAIYRHHVETGAMSHYLKTGWEVAFTENYPWRGLFGLIFWDSIYDANVQAIHHPLQRAPSDFYLPDFYLKREGPLKQLLSDLQTRDDLRRHTERIFYDKYGITNVLVDWRDELLLLSHQIIELLEPEQLRLILLEMALNLRENTRGFPDLLAWRKDGLYSFIEVKSPTDHLSAQQLHWLQFFQTIRVQAKVVRVIWTAN